MLRFILVSVFSLCVLVSGVKLNLHDRQSEHGSDVFELLRDEHLLKVQTSRLKRRDYAVISGSGDHELTNYKPISLDNVDSHEAENLNNEPSLPVITESKDERDIQVQNLNLSTVSEAERTTEKESLATSSTVSSTTKEQGTTVPSTRELTSTEATTFFHHECNETFCKMYESSRVEVTPHHQKSPVGSHVVFECVVFTNLLDLPLIWKAANFSAEYHTIESNSSLSSRLRLENLTLEHSDEYYCRLDVPVSCCHHDVTDKGQLVVYENTNYKKHMIIVGALAAAGILVCVVLHVRRRNMYKEVATEERPTI